MVLSVDRDGLNTLGLLFFPIVAHAQHRIRKTNVHPTRFELAYNTLKTKKNILYFVSIERKTMYFDCFYAIRRCHENSRIVYL